MQIARHRTVDLQSLSQRTVEYLITQVPQYAQDAMFACVRLSGGRTEADILSKLLTSDYSRDYYWIFLREVLIKKESLKYYFKWLVDQCSRHADALEYRTVVAEAAESYRETEQVEHTSPAFTAYSGFLLLAKTDNYRAILNTLSLEGASQEGLQLAGMLIGAYLGWNRM